MKAQRRRFVVEVKRGTSRASFMSTDAAAEKFSSAEDALFGPRVQPAEGQPASAAAPNMPLPMGRVLRDLHEPPPPPLPELPAPARRGRKPGSKNKPKIQLAAPPESPRQGVRPVWADAVASQYASLGATQRPVAEEREPATRTPVPVAKDIASPNRRSRFRERSTILKRYVLGTEPAPGQTGWVRGPRRRQV